MGHPFERLIGRTDHAFVPKEHADIFQRIDRLVLETGEVNENEELIPGSHGEIRTIVTRKKRACLANGARLVVGTITDISELKQREASSRLLFETIRCRCGYSTRDPAFPGRQPGRGRALRLLARTVPDHDAARHQAGRRCRPFRDMVGTAPALPHRSRWRHIKADGSDIDVAAYCQSLQYEGRPAWMAALIDITARKRANEELRRTRQFLDTVIENVPAMLFVKEARSTAIS